MNKKSCRWYDAAICITYIDKRSSSMCKPIHILIMSRLFSAKPAYTAARRPGGSYTHDEDFDTKKSLNISRLKL